MREQQCTEQDKTNLIKALNLLTQLVNNPQDLAAFDEMIKLAHRLGLDHSSHNTHLAGVLVGVVGVGLFVFCCVTMQFIPLTMVCITPLLILAGIGVTFAIIGFSFATSNIPAELAEELGTVKDAYKAKTSPGFFGFFNHS